MTLKLTFPDRVAYVTSLKYSYGVLVTDEGVLIEQREVLISALPEEGVEQVTVTIGRLSGPSTDTTVDSDFQINQLDLIKDVLAMLNKATKDRFFIQVGDGAVIVPEIK